MKIYCLGVKKRSGRLGAWWRGRRPEWDAGRKWRTRLSVKVPGGAIGTWDWGLGDVLFL